MAMGHRELIKTGAEIDAIRAADRIKHRPGVRSYAKRQIIRRTRHEIREQLAIMLGWQTARVLTEEGFES